MTFLDRRAFIRIVGGGVVIAASAPIAGCSAPPAEALEAWQGPRGEPDLRRWALGHAILAPSSHNLQPWLCDLREPDAITLRVDRERLLPMTDPWYRQILVSQGTFIEALVIALRERGVAPEVRLFPAGEFAARALDDRPVARIAWPPKGTPPPRDPLFAQLLLRHTAKVDYDVQRAVSPEVLAALQAATADPSVRFGGTFDLAQVPALRELCRDAARVELLTARTAMESLALTRVGPSEIAAHRDGIAINDPLVRLADAFGLFDRRQPPPEDGAAFRGTFARIESQSRSAMGFVWLWTDTAAHATAGTLRSAEVSAGRAYMRLQLEATRLGLQMHPMSQAPQEFEEMKPLYDRLHELLVAHPARERTVQMFCRIGYCAAQPHTPRRGVDAVLAR